MATRLGRHFIGLNVQFCERDKITCKTLAVRELNSAATGNELSKIILSILRNEFNIHLCQIYSITTDSGSNALAASSSISNLVEAELDQLSAESNLDNVEDVIAAEHLLHSSMCDLKKSALEGVHIICCASHTLALAVDDCLGLKADEDTKKLIEKARNVVCTLRNSNMRKELRKKNLPMPVIDIETRWGSTYDMIKRLIELSGFCQEYESLNEKLKLTDLQWQRLQEMAETLAPVRLLTNQLQLSQLTPGRMLGHWNLALHSLKSHETELSEKLIERMTLREEALLSPPVLAGTYLDPEYQVLLTESQKEIAKIELQSVHQRIVLLDSKKSTSSSDCGESSRARIPIDTAGSQTCEVSLSPMQKMLQAKQKGKIEISNSSGTMQAIRLINSFDHHEPTNVSSVFKFWKNDSKTLSKLAKVVIALPTTQVSVE